MATIYARTVFGITHGVTAIISAFNSTADYLCGQMARQPIYLWTGPSNIPMHRTVYLVVIDSTLSQVKAPLSKVVVTLIV